jgi:HPt (histidine-containing phosphotransfer) domain-containing protein
MALPSEQPLSVNMQYLSEIIKGDEELKRELVELYLGQTTEDLRKLKEAFLISNSEEVKRLAHRMIGGSLACGMMALVNYLRGLEYLAEAEKLSKIPPVLMKVENEFNHISIFLRGLVSPPNAC